jgi:alpha-L-rhamnosidase
MILAQIEEWFHTGLAGIRAADGTIAYRAVVVRPRLVGDLTSVAGRYETPRGTIRSAWEIDGRTFRLAVDIPADTGAEIWVPLRGGHLVYRPQRAEFLRTEDGYAVFRVKAGSYTFVSATR